MIEALTNNAPEWSSKIVGIASSYSELIFWVACVTILVLLFVTIKASLGSRAAKKDRDRYEGQAEAFDKAHDEAQETIRHNFAKVVDAFVEVTKK